MMCASLVDFSGLALKLDEPQDSAKIVEAIKEKPDVSCLNLSGNTLGIRAAEPIGIALERSSKLERCLWSDLFTGRLKSEIAPALRHLSAGIMASGARLVELDLSDNAFGPNGVVGVVDLIASPACATLQILRMNNQGLGHEGCRHLAEALSKGRKSSGGRGLLLKVFSAGRNRLENYGAQLLSDVFTDMGSLEELSLYQNGIGIHGPEGVNALVRMIRSNPNLRVLNLSDNTLTERGGKAIAKALPHLPNLEELHLSDCLLRAAGVTALARAFEDPDTVPNLRVLSLPGNEITRSPGISLILSLADKTVLERLDLNANEFGHAGIRALVSTLDSVGLLHVLPTGSAAGTEPVGGDDDDAAAADAAPWAAAFDEDQGSGDEQDEGESEEHAEDDEQESGHAYEDGDEGDDYDEDEDGYGDEEEEEDYAEDEEPDENDSSFRTVQERPVLKPTFSFRALENALSGETASPGVKGDSTTATTKPGPFGGGLFAGLTQTPTAPGDSAASTRPSLWPSTPVHGGLFSSGTTTTGMLFGSGQPRPFFSPPRLTTAPSPDTLTPSKLKSLLTESNTKVSASVDQLMDILANQQSPISLPMDQIRTVTQTMEPEDVVRFALHLCRRAAPLTKARVEPLAVDLLASCLLPTTQGASPRMNGGFCPAAAPSSRESDRASRATNCLLVHLGAIKAEKHGADHAELSRLDASQWEQRRVAYLSALRELIQRHGDQLGTESRNSIRFLLVQPPRQRGDAVKDRATSGPTEADRLQRDLVSMLETQFSRIQIK